jgi:beta-glucanase (GH16 family)
MLSIFLSVSAKSAEPVATGPLGQEGKWDLKPAFSDEFVVPEVDPKKWQNQPSSWGPWTWDEKNAMVKDGKLVLRMVHEPHTRNGKQNLFYKSGIIRSKHKRTYGYYEARIKGCQLFPGACPAFWIYSDGKATTGEVRYCEIDFVELQMNELNRETKVRDSVHHIDMNLHLRLADKDGTVRWVRPLMDPELCANSWVAPWDPRDDFHVYGCDVTPEAIVWYVDGKEVARKPNKYWHLPMNLTLSLGLRHPHLGWVGQEMKPVPQASTGEGFPTSMEVDYVRVWERRQ